MSKGGELQCELGDNERYSDHCTCVGPFYSREDAEDWADGNPCKCRNIEP